MTTQPSRARLSADAFIAWAAEQPRGRYELAGGEIVAMAPERAAHTRAKLEAAIALRAAIARRGLDCEALIDGMSVRIDQATVYEPDALVRCGPRTPDDALEISDPVIAVEVVSPSSRGIDTGAKLAGYFRLPSLRHYLVVCHHRDDAGGLSTEILHGGVLALDPPGLSLEIGDVFAVR
jgi:Uma2 family endonuclease